MRHRTILSLALILGVVPTLNTSPLLAMPDAQEAQECERELPGPVGEDFVFKSDCTDTPTNNFSVGLQVAVVPEAGSDDQLYAVQFVGEGGDESNPVTGAYIPERFNSQAMVVKVLDGQFAFRTQGPGVIVDPQGQPLESLRAVTLDGTSSNPIGLGDDPDAGTPRTYKEDPDPYPCRLVLYGHTLCELERTFFESGERFVNLDPGDTVFLPDNSTCFLCNTEQVGSTPAKLLIWTPETGFNGDLQSAANAMESSPSDTPTMQGSGRIVGWAFNPGSRCKG